jgi:hypothetical protein
MVLQKIKRIEGDVYSLAEMYYTLLAGVNNISLTPREVQLVAFTAVRGNISYANIRKEFCDKYGTTNPSINNIISKLKKTGLLIKDGGKIKVAPQIVLNFEDGIVLEIRLLRR